jgi:hypothetical protein
MTNHVGTDYRLVAVNRRVAVNCRRCVGASILLILDEGLVAATLRQYSPSDPRQLVLA